MHARLETNHHLSKKYYDKNLWCKEPFDSSRKTPHSKLKIEGRVNAKNHKTLWLYKKHFDCKILDKY